MKTKILTTATILCLGIAFQGCEKDDNTLSGNSETYTKEKSVNSKSLTYYGDNSKETYIINSAITTRDHFSNLSIVPEASDWFQHFSSAIDFGNLNINAGNETENEVEANSILSDYFDAYYEFTNLTLIELNNFRDSWLTTVSSSTNINSEEKNYISDIIYVTIGLKKIFSQGLINTSEYPPLPEAANPWEIRFNLCMRGKVPDGFFRRIIWALDGEMFMDVGDCIIEASSSSKPGPQ